MIANTLGAAILAGTVTPATFAGLPIIVCGYNLTSTSDVRWQVALEIETIRYGGVPMIGVDLAGSPSQLTTLLWAVKLLSQFLAPGNRPLVYADVARALGVPPVCGPFLCMPDASGTWIDEVNAAVALAANFVGTRLGNAVRFGAFALGPLSSAFGAVGDVWERPYGPPVYRTLYPSTGVSYAIDVEKIVTLWRDGAVSTASQIAALQALNAIRPGISRRDAPFLIDWLAI